MPSQSFYRSRFAWTPGARMAVTSFESGYPPKPPVASGVIAERSRSRRSATHDGKLAAGKTYDERLWGAADNLPRLDVGIWIGSQCRAIRERDLERATFGRHIGDASPLQVFDCDTPATLVSTDCIANIRVEPRLGISACFEHKSLVISDIHDRPTHEEVDLAHVKRPRRTLRGHCRTLAQARLVALRPELRR
jgi:hypothetical protein